MAQDLQVTRSIRKWFDANDGNVEVYGTRDEDICEHGKVSGECSDDLHHEAANA